MSLGKPNPFPLVTGQPVTSERELNAAKVRIALLEELVGELQAVYYNQDDARITELCEELGL